MCYFLYTQGSLYPNVRIPSPLFSDLLSEQILFELFRYQDPGSKVVKDIKLIHTGFLRPEYEELKNLSRISLASLKMRKLFLATFLS